MSEFRNWWFRNQDSISWFIIGWLSFAAFDNLIREHYLWAAIDAVVIWVNYKLISVRL
jgi:hypothetical protein